MKAARAMLGGKPKAKARKKVSPEGQKKISEKIPVLMAEGKSQKAAIGEAYGMLRGGGLKRHGVYVPKGKR